MLRVVAGWTILAGLWTAGCADEGLATGAGCVADTECASGLCTSNRCTEAAADDDADGLSNGDERDLNTDALHPDTDRDGRWDGAEVGDPDAPLDSDGDGRIDALESRILDFDADCLPDQLDSDPEGAADPAALAPVHCITEGECGATVTASCAEGVPHCAYEGERVETCDGKDNDCDGDTDEELPPLTCGVGECAGEKASCSKGVSLVCVPADPVDEVCDGKDNDCDGELDNGFDLGFTCAGVGVCPPGVWECDPETGGRRCSTAAGGSAAVVTEELCNQLDDDCDGDVDEDFEVGLPCGSCGGVTACTFDLLTVFCTTDEMVGGAELCDGEDNDCDGQTDEQDGLERSLAGCPSTGVCIDTLSTQPACELTDSGWELVCVPAPDSPWEPSTETGCDGKDNDCDGLTDEPFTWAFQGVEYGIGKACGLGQCAGGVVQCAVDGKGAICSTANQKSTEVCNDQDDDCDGATDEGMAFDGAALGEPCKGVGACGWGIVECLDGAAVCSTNPGSPSSGVELEICNGQDDDCDGDTDELDDVLGNAPVCAGAGVCAGGEATPVACVDGVLACDPSTVSDYEEGFESVCDAKDNDCDGLVDEGLAKMAGAGWESLGDGTPPPRAEVTSAVVPGVGIVMVGGGASKPGLEGPVSAPLDDTWIYRPEIESWDHVEATGLPPRSGATLECDPGAGADGRLLLFGGETEDGELSADVWVAQVGVWEWAPLDVGPGAVAPRSGHASVFDPAVGWMWVIGGAAGGPGEAVVALDLVEEEWVASLPKGPGWRDGVAAVLEPKGANDASASGRIVVFGGQAPDGAFLTQTWLLTIGASGWTPFDASTSPPPRRDHRMAFAGGGAWLFGGTGASGQELSDLWRFDLGTLSWSPVVLPDGPQARRSPGLEPDGDGLVLLGGSGGGESMSDAWRLQVGDEPAWQPLGTGALPPPRMDAALVLEGDGQLLLYGGVRQGLQSVVALPDLWRIDGQSGEWALLSDDGPARSRTAAAWDAVGSRLFVHGGSEDALSPKPSVASSDLQMWHDGAWSAMPIDGLPALAAHAAAWDPIQGRLLLHGGLMGGQPMGGLWAVDPLAGEVILLQPTGDAPPPLHGHVLVIDPVADRAIAAAGIGAGGGVYALDLEEVAWSHVGAVPSMAVDRPFAVVEPTGGRLLLGSAASGSPLFWEVDLAAGSIAGLVMEPAPDSLNRTAAAFDPQLGKAFLFGGSGPAGHPRDEPWRLPWVCPQ